MLMFNEFEHLEMKEKILELLSQREMTVTELANALGISKATVSHHLERLKKEGLVKVSREERVKNFIRRFYTIAIPNGNVGKLIVDLIKDSAERRDGKELFRNTVRLLGYCMLRVSPHLFKRLGYEVGYSLSFEGANLEDLAELWENLGMGKTSCTNRELVVEDCYFCSRLPKIGETYCKFDEGLISGFMAKSTGKVFDVEEVKCWGLGDELCEFRLNPSIHRISP